MIENFKKFHAKLKNWIVNILFKKFLVPAALIFVYFFVVGPTSIFAKVFFRKKLSIDSHQENSSWLKAEGYNPTLDESLKQS